jgi:hypothetical protein
MRHFILTFLLPLLFLSGCKEQSAESQTKDSSSLTYENLDLEKRLNKYTKVSLKTDLSHLSDKQLEMIKILLQAGEVMNELFWYEAFGEKEQLFTEDTDDGLKEYLNINYGPWDRLADNEAFVNTFEDKPKGANFYPSDMTKEEFESAVLPGKSDLYTFIRRDEDGNLISVPYHKQFSNQVKKVSELLKKASELAEDPGLKKYLSLRSEAILTDDYQASDMAWLDMKNNFLDVVIGPIETYEDQLFGYKAAHECFILIKDTAWSNRLAKYGAFLPKLQEGIPVDTKYKTESPGTDTELNAYDVIFYAGDCNSGSKTIAINLPNDEEVQLEKGTRRLQLKNAMRAKFDKILVPIVDKLIDPEQRKYITFDAFFSNTMFHEVAHGLGIKNTITGKGTVRKALQEHYSAIEEGKADVLGLYMINQLHAMGEIQADLMDHYVTFLASIFRSVRFGTASAHGKANMIRFNYFLEQEAISYNEESGTYRVNQANFKKASENLSNLILTLQGDGDYERTAELVKDKGTIKIQLQSDLDRLTEANIPVDVVFEQGPDVLGL